MSPLPVMLDPASGRPHYSRRALVAFQQRIGQLAAERGAA